MVIIISILVYCGRNIQSDQFHGKISESNTDILTADNFDSFPCQRQSQRDYAINLQIKTTTALSNSIVEDVYKYGTSSATRAGGGCAGGVAGVAFATPIFGIMYSIPPKIQ